MRRTWFTSGDWNAICDVCGFKYKATDLKQRWDGLMVCSKDYETRHPQELIRPIPEQQKLPWTRPEATDVFIAVCTVDGISAIPGLAIAGCSISGRSIIGTGTCSIDEMTMGSDYSTADCARANGVFNV